MCFLVCDMFGEDEKLNADTEKNFEKDCHICDAIGHEIKAVNHLMHRKMLESAAKNGVDKVTIMHGWIIAYLYNNQDNDIFQKNLESEFSISRSSVTNILQLMEKKPFSEIKISELCERAGVSRISFYRNFWYN